MTVAGRDPDDTIRTGGGRWQPEDVDESTKPWSAERRELTWNWALLAAVVVALAAGAVLWFIGRRATAEAFWAGTTIAGLVPAVLWVLQALRQRQVGVDIIAVLALAGALGVREYLAGAVIALMLATGRTLESYAERRAARDLRELLRRAPRSARRQTADGQVEVVPLSAVRPDDRLLVGPGETVPVDGVIEDEAALDESVVTGESQIVNRAVGETVASGVINAGAAFRMRATATAAESTYAGIVRLAQEATARKAPMVRIADRYAAAFVPFTLILAGLAWLVSGEFIRAVAVLVVATPCPLILATPIAIVSGLSRAARRGVVVREGAALEQLGRARTLLVDKTGTLTAGRPQVMEMITAPGLDRDEVLRLAASVEQLSPHVLATALVREATDHGLTLTTPSDVTEEPGKGVRGRVDGRTVWVGQLAVELPDWADRLRQRAELDGAAIVWISVDDVVSGALLLQDPVRPDARHTVGRLRQSGLQKVIMVTGDRPEVAAEVARVVGVDDVVARCGPERKVERVRAEAAQATTVMVGDGVNDAPALAAADVGVAMGATGATASADVADAVLTVNRLDRLADAVEIARYARRIAVQSAGVGMGLSVAAMGVASVGLLPPVIGAFLQEGIDVLVIVNALRALRGGVRRQRLPDEAEELVGRFAAEHEEVRPTLSQVRATADLIATDPASPQCVPALRNTHTQLVERLLPHEDAEEHRLLPALAGPLGSDAATAPASRSHAEIHRLVDRIDGHLRRVSDSRLPADLVPDLLATLYGLDAVLRLHFAQEEEVMFSLASEPPATE